MDWSQIFGDSIRNAIGPLGATFALAAVGLNLQFGYTGLLNFGQAGFAAVGAYGLAISVTYYDVPFVVGILIALVAAVLFALILGFPTLRLRGDYLAIVTIAAAEIIRLTMQATNFRRITGGADGLQGFSGTYADLNPFGDGVYGFWRLRFREEEIWQMLVGWIVVLLACLLVRAAIRSPWGRVLKAIREDEDAVRSLGKNVYVYKLQSLVIGGTIGAVAGMLGALAQGSATPTNFATGFTFIYYAMVILGGTATVWGPVLGAIVFNFLLQFTQRFLQDANDSFIPTSIISDNEASVVRFMLLGLTIVLLMVFRPQGLVGDRREAAVNVRR